MEEKEPDRTREDRRLPEASFVDPLGVGRNTELGNKSNEEAGSITPGARISNATEEAEEDDDGKNLSCAATDRLPLRRGWSGARLARAALRIRAR